MFTRTLAALVFAVGCAHVASAQKVEATLSHWVPGTHPLQKLGMEPWAQSIKDATGGEVEIKISPASQLGHAKDHYDMARDGIVDIGFINPGYQPGRFPILAAAELPFHFANAKGAVRGVTEWYHKYAPKEMKDTYFCMALTHDPGTFHSKTPILVPADVKGKTVRPANATEGRFVQLLGGSSVQVPAGEMREVLSKGVADMTQSPWQSLYIFGADSLVKHHLDIPLYASINAFVFNKGFMAKLSAKSRKVVEDHCTPEWAERMSAGWADVEANGRNKILADSTHTMHKPNAEQLKAWKTAAAPLTDEWKANIKSKGLGDPDAIYKGMVDALKKYNSFAGE
jgi:TRAP-type C4-dicarboxylate transport system substrate-binding protein